MLEDSSKPKIEEAADSAGDSAVEVPLFQRVNLATRVSGHQPSDALAIVGEALMRLTKESAVQIQTTPGSLRWNVQCVAPGPRSVTCFTV